MRRVVRWGLGLVALVATGLLFGGCLPNGDGQTWVVTVFGDAPDAVVGDGVCEATPSGGDCTLRAAVQESNVTDGGDVIELAAGTYTLSVAGTGEDDAATGDLDVHDVVMIGGAPATIDADGIDRAFEVHDGTLLLAAQTVTGGSGTGGAGVEVAGGTVQVVHSTISSNTSTDAAGGVNVTSGSAVLKGATISGNTGALVGGVDFSGGDGRVENSTISGNTATDGDGGGLEIGPAGLPVTNATITDNAGGGLDNAADATLTATIVGDQATGADCTGGPAVSGGYNLDSDGTCGLAGTGDVSSTDPLLHPLADNGGTAETHLPAYDSPAIDSGGNCLDDDQRMTSRPQGADCDMGAAEVVLGESPGSDCGPPPNLVPYANLQYCDLSFEIAPGVDLTDADLQGAILDSIDLSGANLAGANLDEVSAFAGDFTGALFDDPLCCNAASLQDADFTSATLTDAAAYQSPSAPATLGTTWTDATCPNGLDDLTNGGTCDDTFTGFDCAPGLYGPYADLHDCNLSFDDLTAETLTDAILTDAILDGADLTGVALDGASLDGASLDGTNLTSADLTGATVTGTVFSATTDVTGSDFTDADLTGATGTPSGAAVAVWSNTVCPDGVNSDSETPSTCVGHFLAVLP